MCIRDRHFALPPVARPAHGTLHYRQPRTPSSSTVAVLVQVPVPVLVLVLVLAPLSGLLLQGRFMVDPAAVARQKSQ
eukprot:1742198-Lingulodinium_polyedra.AAC.1